MDILSKHFSKLQKSKVALIQKSFFHLCSSLVRVKPVTDKLMPKVAPALLGCFSITEKTVQTTMLEALVTMMKGILLLPSLLYYILLEIRSVHPDCWKSIDPRKQVFPNLWNWLKQNGYGTSEETYQFLLPFLALLPDDIIGDIGVFAQKFFESIWKGFSTQQATQSLKRTESVKIITALSECHLLLLKKAKNSKNSKVQTQLVTNDFLGIVTQIATIDNLTYSASLLFNPVCSSLSKIVADTTMEEDVADLFKKFGEFIDSQATNPEKPFILHNTCQFFVSLSQQFQGKEIPQILSNFISEVKTKTKNFARARGKKHFFDIFFEFFTLCSNRLNCSLRVALLSPEQLPTNRRIFISRWIRMVKSSIDGHNCKPTVCSIGDQDNLSSNRRRRKMESNFGVSSCKFHQHNLPLESTTRISVFQIN